MPDRDAPIGDEADLELALALADVADEITLARHQAPDLQVEIKPDLTPVTEVDRAVERALRDRLTAVRPQDAVLGEELGETLLGDELGEAVLGEELGADERSSARRWIIDPIDGTKSYLRGMPTWSTLIALEEAGVITVGVVTMPALGRRWWARRGGGAYAGGRPIRVSSVADLADAQLVWSGIEDWEAVGRLDRILALGRACWRTRGIGDAWQYMLVAEGIAEIACDPDVKLWDLASVKVIVEEAGGRFTDLRGADTAAGGSGLATNGWVHEAALAIVAAPDTVVDELPGRV